MDTNSCMEQVNTVLTHVLQEIIQKMQNASLEEKAFLLKILQNIAMAAELNDYGQASLLASRDQQHAIPDRKSTRKSQLDEIIKFYKAEMEENNQVLKG